MGSPMVITLGQQYNVGERPTVILYTCFWISMVDVEASCQENPHKQYYNTKNVHYVQAGSGKSWFLLYCDS